MDQVKLKVKKAAPLPTKPKIRVFAVVGMPGTKSTAMRRCLVKRKAILMKISQV